MLSKEQKEKLRNIQMYELQTNKKNVETWSTVKKEFVVLSPYQIVESITKQILNSGFSKVERVSHFKANCIIRVFQMLNYEYYFDTVFNLYGAKCFVKSGMNWISECQTYGYTFRLNYNEYIVNQWLYQDEMLSFNTDFMDVYVKVS